MQEIVGEATLRIFSSLYSPSSKEHSYNLQLFWKLCCVGVHYLAQTVPFSWNDQLFLC